MSLLPHLTRYTHSAEAPVTGSAIWLHGLGASGHDFEPLVPELGIKANVRFIFPHAPNQPVTINMGMVMPSWYDIYSLGEIREVNQAQVADSVQAIRALIEHEHAQGVPYQNIVLAGFSQGGAVALQTALHFEHQLGGLMALSTYLFDPDRVPAALDSVNRETPFLVQHGTEDPVVPFSLGKRSQIALKQAGYKVEWQSFSMGHEVCFAQLREIAVWMQSRWQA